MLQPEAGPFSRQHPIGSSRESLPVLPVHPVLLVLRVQGESADATCFLAWDLVACGRIPRRTAFFPGLLPPDLGVASRNVFCARIKICTKSAPQDDSGRCRASHIIPGAGPGSCW